MTQRGREAASREVKEAGLSNEALSQFVWRAMMREVGNDPNELARMLFNRDVVVGGMSLLPAEISSLDRSLSLRDIDGGFNIAIAEQNRGGIAKWTRAERVLGFRPDDLVASQGELRQQIAGVGEYMERLVEQERKIEEAERAGTAPQKPAAQTINLVRTLQQMNPDVIGRMLGISTNAFTIQEREIDGQPLVFRVGRVTVASLLAEPFSYVTYKDEENALAELRARRAAEEARLAELEMQRQALVEAARRAEADRRRVEIDREMAASAGRIRSMQASWDMDERARGYGYANAEEWKRQNPEHWRRYDPLFVWIDSSGFADSQMRNIIESFNFTYAGAVNLALQLMGESTVNEYVGMALRGEDISGRFGVRLNGESLGKYLARVSGLSEDRVLELWGGHRKAFLGKAVGGLTKVRGSVMGAFKKLVECQSVFTTDGAFFLDPAEALVVAHASRQVFNGMEVAGSKLLIVGENTPLSPGDDLAKRFDRDRLALR